MIRVFASMAISLIGLGDRIFSAMICSVYTADWGESVSWMHLPESGKMLIGAKGKRVSYARCYGSFACYALCRLIDCYDFFLKEGKVCFCCVKDAVGCFWHFFWEIEDVLWICDSVGTLLMR